MYTRRGRGGTLLPLPWANGLPTQQKGYSRPCARTGTIVIGSKLCMYLIFYMYMYMRREGGGRVPSLPVPWANGLSTLERSF